MRRRTIKHKVNRRTVARWTHRDWLLSFACPMSPRRHRAPKIKRRRRRRCEMFFPLAIARHRTNCNFASFSTNKTTIVRSHLLLFYCHFLEKVPRTQYLHVRLLKFSFICPLPPFRFILFARCWVRRMRTRVCVLVATEDFRRQFFFASPSESCWRVLDVCVWINAFDICLQRRNFRTLLHLVSLFFAAAAALRSRVSPSQPLLCGTRDDNYSGEYDIYTIQRIHGPKTKPFGITKNKLCVCVLPELFAHVFRLQRGPCCVSQVDVEGYT